MNKATFFGVFAALSVCWFHLTLASAQPSPSPSPSSSSPSSSPSPSEESGDTGFVSGYVLSKTGRPIAGARILQKGATIATTDGEGGFFVQLPVGTHTLTLDPDEGPALELRPIPVVAGTTSEVLIVVRAADKVDVDVEAASPDRMRAVSTRLGSATSTVTGTLRGRILDEEKNTPVPNARILVRGLRADFRSDAHGEYTVVVPAGTIDLTVIHPDFSTRSMTDIVVQGDAIVELDVMLAPQSVALAELVVTIPKLEGGTVFVLRERRDAASVSDMLGADQISKAGDSDAAGALQRVTGVTVVGGRFIYVRGLGERYSSTLLNGSTLPSPDPERRVVPLDLFPASALGSILVQKTYSPDLPGEFGGGAVNLRTREIPKEFEANLEVSGGFRTHTTLRTAPTYDGGGLDFLGFGVGARALPSEFKAATERSRIQTKTVTGQGFTAEELERFGESLDTDYQVGSAKTLPDLGVSLEVGGPFELLGVTSGAFVGLNYDRGTSVRRIHRRSLLPDLSVRTEQNLVSTENTTSIGGLFGADFEFNPQHALRLTTFLSRISEKTARTANGRFPENDIESYRLQWVEQMMLAQQLRGHHVFAHEDGPALDWRYMVSVATRDEPNLRDIFYIIDNGVRRLDTNDFKNQRYYGELFDVNHDLGLDFTYPFKGFGDEPSKVQAGAMTILKSREVDVRRFTYAGGLASPLDQAPPDRIFNPDTIGSGAGLVQLDEVTLDDDAYAASEERFGGYLMGDLGLVKRLRLMTGARIEVSHQKVETFLPPAAIAQGPNQVAELSTTDILPAATLSWEFVDDMLLRLAFSRTVARPNFRELSPAVFRDPAGTLEFQGNPDLKRTMLTNVDLRFEWYPSPGETFSVAGFWKSFQDPVEVRLTAGAVDREIPINVPSAVNFGGEVEFRKDFSFVADALSDLYAAGNLTVVSSRVNLESLDPEVRGILTTLERPLQGQSPFVINMQLGYDNVDQGMSVAALYNVFGERITALGVRGLPDRYESPVHRVDLVASKRFGRCKLSLKAKNMLDPWIRLRQGGVVVEEYRVGRVYSVGLTVDLD